LLVGRSEDLNFAGLTSDLCPCDGRHAVRTLTTAVLEVLNSPVRKTQNVNLPGSHLPLFAQKSDQEPEQKTDAEGGNYSQEDFRRIGEREMNERRHGSKLIEHART
jgi:hypothetical protein